MDVSNHWIGRPPRAAGRAPTLRRPSGDPSCAPMPRAQNEAPPSSGEVSARGAPLAPTVPRAAARTRLSVGAGPLR